MVTRSESVRRALPRVARYAAGTVFTGAALAAGSLAWGACERRFPVLRRYDVPVPAYRGIRPFTLLHISDLHMYPGQDFLAHFLEAVAERENVDLVISTGDNFGSAQGLELAFAAHRPFFDLPGAFVLGSNDYFSARRKSWSRYLRSDARTCDAPGRTPDLPWQDLVHAFTDAGWHDLSNASALCVLRLDADKGGRPPVAQVFSPETPRGLSSQMHGGTENCATSANHHTFAGVESRPWQAHEDSVTRYAAYSGAQRVALIGVDDPHMNRDQIPLAPKEWHRDDVFRVAVAHAPYRRVLDAFTDMGADLILAGHTHGGQFGLPGVGALVTNCDVPRQWAKGLHEWVSPKARSLLHVSAGLGTSPFVPFRIATRPEASLLRICPQ
nr:metallophosphoesterase [Schaalia sp. lx-100]